MREGVGASVLVGQRQWLAEKVVGVADRAGRRRVGIAGAGVGEFFLGDQLVGEEICAGSTADAIYILCGLVRAGAGVEGLHREDVIRAVVGPIGDLAAGRWRAKRGIGDRFERAIEHVEKALGVDAARVGDQVGVARAVVIGVGDQHRVGARGDGGRAGVG